MLKKFEVNVHLNTRVLRISPGDDKRRRLHFHNVNLTPSGSLTTATFDIMMLTMPFAFNSKFIDPTIQRLALTADG